MTTPTPAVLRVRPLPSTLGAAALTAGQDGTGNPVPVSHDRAGAQLRCCLRDARPGEGVVLITVVPDGPRGAFAERGPVFVHAHDCGGAADDGYPAGWLTYRQVVRAYDADGAITGGEVVEPGGPHEDVIARWLTDPDVAFVHTRNVVFGCYLMMFERRAGG